MVPVDVGKRSEVALVANHHGEVVVDPVQFDLTKSGTVRLLEVVAEAGGGVEGSGWDVVDDDDARRNSPVLLIETPAAAGFVSGDGRQHPGGDRVEVNRGCGDDQHVKQLVGAEDPR